MVRRKPVKIFYTELIYRSLRLIAKPIVRRVLRPIILNVENIPEHGPIIISPNHRATLDPFVVSCAMNTPIHWLALKRFFTGEDSIFNNSKNPILCWLTRRMFVHIGAVPFDRNGSNLSSIKQLNQYLSMGSSIGIFPEGSTNKNPDKSEVNVINPVLMKLASHHHAWILPVSIIWHTDEENRKQHVIINFREAFKTESMDPSVAAEQWYAKVREGLQENKQLLRTRTTSGKIRIEKEEISL